MKNIEEIIRDNRNLFEDQEPIEGHLDRFNWKLEKRLHSDATKRSIVPYLLRAAVVTLLITLSSLWTWDHFIRKDNKGMTLGQVSPQYKEVESYYVHQVNLMESELGDIDLKNNPDQKKELMKEMKSMDSVYVQLQKELKAERVWRYVFIKAGMGRPGARKGAVGRPRHLPALRPAGPGLRFHLYSNIAKALRPIRPKELPDS